MTTNRDQGSITAPLVISIKGIRCYASHGVFPEEKVRDQLFLVDIEVSLAVAPSQDELSETVDYANLVELAQQVLAAPPVNLIETLAKSLVERVLASDNVVQAKVTIHKPGVRLVRPIADVSVTTGWVSR